MDQTTSQIEDQIRARRATLKSNIEELESRVRSATDWRQYYRRHTGALITAAFGGGIALFALLSRSTHAPAGARQDAQGRTTGPDAVRPRANGELVHAVDKIKSALIGVAAGRLNSVIAQFVPGFAERMSTVEAKAARYR